MKIVRAIRTFVLKESIERHPYGYYTAIGIAVTVGLNVMMYRHMKKMYPDWETVSKRYKEDYVKFKRQELADIQRYNSDFEQMRADVKHRTTPSP